MEAAALEDLLATVARLAAGLGGAREVAVLAHATARLEEVEYDGRTGATFYELHIDIPPSLYSQVREHLRTIEPNICELVKEVLRPPTEWVLTKVVVAPVLTSDSTWRDRARSWLAGEGVTNQGRVRSENVAPKSCDGLLFRSQPEILLYRALKSLGISFAPLPVFIRGGESYRRIEPDFVIIHGGIVLVVEVDGDTVHQETPAEAHARTTMLVHEGVHLERIRASDCDDEAKARQCAADLLKLMKKLKNAHA